MKKKSIFLILIMLVAVVISTVVNAAEVNRIGTSKVGKINVTYTDENSEVYVNKITKLDGTVVRYVYSKNFVVTPESILKLKSVLAPEYSSLIPDNYTAEENVGIKVCSDSSLVNSMNENWISAEWVGKNVIAVREVKSETNETGDGVNITAISDSQSHTILFNEIKNAAEVENIEKWKAREKEKKASWDAAEAEKHEADSSYIPQEYVPSEYVPLDFNGTSETDIENVKTLENNQISVSVGMNLTTTYAFIGGKLIEVTNIESIIHIANIYTAHTIIDDTESITTDVSNSTIVDTPSEESWVVKQTGAGTKDVTLTWIKNENANGYLVQVKNGKKWKTVATIKNNNTTSKKIKKLKAGKKYTYQIVSYVNVKKKVKKKTKTVKETIEVLGPITAITKPSTPKVAIKGSAHDYVKVSYKKKVGGTSYYILSRSTEKKGTYTEIAKITGTYTDTDVKTGTTYYYKVKACNANGFCSGNSGAVSKKPSLGKLSIKVKSPESGKVLITPTKTVSGEDGYVIEYSTKSKKGFKKIANLDVYTKEYLQESTEEKKLTGKKTYYYRARAYKVVDGNPVYGAWSKTQKVTVK